MRARAIIAALVVVALMSGCFSYRASKTTAKVGGGITIAGLVLTAAASGLQDSSDKRGYAVLTGFVLLIAPGGLIGVGGLLGMAAHGGYSASRTIAKVGAGIVITGLALAGVSAAHQGYERGNSPGLGMVTGLVLVAAPGSVVGVGGLLGMALHDKPREPSQVVPLPHAGAKPESVELHERALGAALRGDCTTVLLIGGRVQQIDREYYEADFVISPAIKACVPVTQPVPSPVTPPTETQPAPQVTPPGPTP